MMPAGEAPAWALVQRKRAELRAKTASLFADIKTWQDASARPPFTKHFTQIRRISAHIAPVRAFIEQDLAPDADPAAILGRSASTEEKILAAYSIWEFFRGKLALRQDPTYCSYLEACDELAWECYAPALHAHERTRAAAAVGSDTAAGRDVLPLKEPPLVFLNAGWSPFVQPREAAFDVPRPRGARPWLKEDGFRQIVSELPVPVVGIPWYSAAHPPGTLVIAHEVGHVVDSDFGLTQTIEQLVEHAAPPDRQSEWKQWAREIFADAYGCVCAGPPFASSLLDLLVTDAGRVEGESLAGVHPPRTLRVLLNASVLEQTGHGPEADELRRVWTRQYPAHASEEYVPDISSVARAVLGGPYPSLGIGRLDDLIAYAPIAGDARIAANELRRSGGLSVSLARPLFAGARLLYDADSDGFAATDAATRIAARIVASRPRGLRAGEPRRDAQALAAIIAADEHRGRTMFARLFSS